MTRSVPYDVPHFSGSPSVTMPDGMCPAHTHIWKGWARLRYNPANPTEWPGGAHIMDSRTTHAERAAGWARKTLEQLTSIEDVCKRGNSPQCTPGHHPPVPETAERTELRALFEAAARH